MDHNIVKENNDFTNTEICNRSEPLDNSNEFLTDASEGDHQHDIKPEIFEPKITLEVEDEPRDFGNISDQSPIEDVQIKEEGSMEEHYLENNQEKLQNNLEFGESSRKNQPSVQEETIHIHKKKFICDECGKTFRYKHHLNDHLRVHSGVKPFKCDICEKTFSQKAHLKSHILIHTDEKHHKCNICNQIFKHKSNLVSHELIHSGDKPYACDQCDQKFSRKNNLIRHKRVHSGEKPYVCDICGKAFTAKSILTTHILVHAEEKPYSCDICNKSYTQKRGLDQHKLKQHKN